MPVFRVLLSFFFCASLGLAADVVTLSEKKVSGELTSIDGKQVVVQTADGPVTLSVEKELRILDVAPLPSAPNPAAALLVELTDGSQIFCTADGLTIKEDRLTLTLPDGKLRLELPLKALSYVLKLKCPHDAGMNVRENADWKACLKARKNLDMACIWRETKVKNAEGVEETVWRLNNPEGTFADKGEGTVLEFKLEGSNASRKLNFNSKLTQAWVFANKPDAAAPVQLCKLFDKDQNVLVAAKVEAKPGEAFRVTTVSGATLSYPREQVARLDFSKGRLEYLSDIEPVIEKPEPGADRWDRYRFFKEEEKRNKNLDGGKLKLDGKEYDKGLNLPAPTNLLYKLNGEFKEFSCVIGVDDAVPGNGQVEVVIEGDNGRKLWSARVSRKGIVVEGRKPEETKKAQPVRLNIKDVQELRIRVRSTGLLDYGNHVDLADVKINK